jgi:hypothetical protein
VPRAGLALFFLALVVAHGARDAALVVRWWDEFRTGRFSLGAPGREETRNHLLMQEENVLYLAAFREVVDGRLLGGDDYVYETKHVLAPTPLVPRLLGGLALFVAGRDTGWAVALLHLLHGAGYVVLFYTLRAARLPSLVAACVVTAMLVAGQGWAFDGIAAKVLLFDRIGPALMYGTHRFIAPILTLPFFFAFLIPLFRDPRVSRRGTAIAVGVLGGLGAYVYYANLFVVAIVGPVYLALAAWLWPEHRRNHVTAALVALLTIVPFAVLVLATRSGLPADYLARVGSSQFGRGRHLAWINPRVVVTFAVLYALVPVAAVVAAARRAAGPPRMPGLRAWARACATTLSGTAAAPLVLLALVNVAACVVPSVLQFAVDLPQPSRIYARLGAACNVITLGVLGWFVVARWMPPRPAHRARWRAAVIVVVALVLAGVVGYQARAGWTSATEAYDIAPAHTAVTQALRARAWPCVVSSSSAVLDSLVTSRTRCDSLAPNILLSVVSTDEAVDRHVASWVLERRSLDDVLAFFRLRAVPPGDHRRVVCAVGGDGADRQGWYTDGLALTYHLAPCRPAEVRARIVATYTRYMAAPDEILRRYRVDFVYSASGDLHPAIRDRFTPAGVPGLFARAGG